MNGYKATDKNMKCRDFQFELGKWYEVDGDVELCKNGFHFCDHWGGVWAYYSSDDTRVFRVECEDVLDLPVEPGADHKRVCRRIRLVVESPPTDGYRNSGYGNSGDSNSGNGNSGYGNSGDRNSGYRNSGNWNSGYGNAMDRSSDIFCIKPKKVRCFDGATSCSYGELFKKYPEICHLGELLLKAEPIDFEPFKNIPNITPQKLKDLHKKHLEARK
jgi:hypothetical protein